MLLSPPIRKKTKINALFDSGANINVLRERDAEEIRHETIRCIIREALRPFKIHYANTELEKTLATYTMNFEVGDYTLEETFIILSHY